MKVPYGSRPEKKMRIELKPHRWPYYFVWAVVDPTIIFAAFTAPLWSEWFWALGGWNHTHAASLLWLAVATIALNFVVGFSCADMMEKKKW